MFLQIFVKDPNLKSYGNPYADNPLVPCWLTERRTWRNWDSL